MSPGLFDFGIFDMVYVRRYDEWRVGIRHAFINYGLRWSPWVRFEKQEGFWVPMKGWKLPPGYRALPPSISSRSFFEE